MRRISSNKALTRKVHAPQLVRFFVVQPIYYGLSLQTIMSVAFTVIILPLIGDVSMNNVLPYATL